MNPNASLDREARRQQWLLRALWRDADAGETSEPWLRAAARPVQRGLQAYRINAAVSAERALASAYPSVAALVGNESFGALARDLWRRHPPERGDLGVWGAALPAFIADSESLASEPYLADTARLDWLVHLASRAADTPAAPPLLDALATDAPESLCLRLSPGTAVLSSTWPVAAIWLAHLACRADDSERFAGVRAALAAGRGENALVRRDGYAVRVDTLDAAAAAFTRALLDGATLAHALDTAGNGFAFDQWLVQALQQRWLVAALTVQPTSTDATP
jgi:hypothetical protein